MVLIGFAVETFLFLNEVIYFYPFWKAPFLKSLILGEFMFYVCATILLFFWIWISGGDYRIVGGCGPSCD